MNHEGTDDKLDPSKITNQSPNDIESKQRNDDLNAKLLLKQEQQKKEYLRSRQTDGYFNKDNNNPIKMKQNKPKKHIYARRATYLPRADKKRLSMKISEEYRIYSREYVDHGYGTIINIIAWMCNVYMSYFSALMRLCS